MPHVPVVNWNSMPPLDPAAIVAPVCYIHIPMILQFHPIIQPCFLVKELNPLNIPDKTEL